MIDFDQKLFEVLEDAPDRTKRLYLYLDTLARQDASDDEMTAIILGFTVEQVREARVDFKERIERWNQMQKESVS